MKRIVNAIDFCYDASLHAHLPTGKSETIPGQDVSVRYMFSRFVQERPLPVVGQPYFSGDGDESFLELDRLTIQEKLDMKRDVDQFVDSATTVLKQKKAAEELTAKQKADQELQELRAYKAKSEAVQ